MDKIEAALREIATGGLTHAMRQEARQTWNAFNPPLQIKAGEYFFTRKNAFVGPWTSYDIAKAEAEALAQKQGDRTRAIYTICQMEEGGDTYKRYITHWPDGSVTF
jgi:hypothetical protein